MHEEAVLHLKRAVALDPAPQAYAALGQAYDDVQEDDPARDCLEEALQRDPQMVGARNSLGDVLLELGEMRAGPFKD